MHPKNRWLRRVAAVLAAVGLAAAPTLTARAAPAAPPVAAAAPVAPLAATASNVHIFYYSWYGNPSRAGSYRHWPQGGHTPPQAIGANFYPTLGAYDSGDPATVRQHMAWIRDAGVGVLVYSWWGQGSYEDALAPTVLDAAAAYGLRVAWHLEPYAGRTAASTVADITYIHSRYGGHPAFHRDAAHGNRAPFYVFESLRISDWSPLAQVRGTSIVLAQTTDTTKVAHFGGMYTYDGIAGATAPGWATASAFCRANGLVWAPSVAPGYLDDRAVPGNTTPTVDRAGGVMYDQQWGNALDPAHGGPPTWVSITSFNEWHEGSTIEPASANPPAGHGYLTYSGAYGHTGAAAETAYLDRTRYWVNRFDPSVDPAPGPDRPLALRAHANGRHVSAPGGGASPLIADQPAVDAAERFDLVDQGDGTVALRARVNGRYVAAENAGAAPLIANRTAVGLWERFHLVRNGDGSVSLRAAVNDRYVVAENAGAAPLVANRTAIGPWERFDLVGG